MPHTPLAWLTYVIFSAICLWAIFKGEIIEKGAGLALLIVTVVTPSLQDRVHWMDPEGRLLTEDVVLLVVFLGLALRFGRSWMMFSAAFQTLSTLSHPAAHFAQRVGPLAYLSIFQLFSYGVYLSLGAGVLAQVRSRTRHRRRERLENAPYQS